MAHTPHISLLVADLNEKQREEVLANLSKATGVKKGVDPKKLFDLENWITLTIDALTPELKDLYSAEGLKASELVGKPIDPLLDPNALAALNNAICLRWMGTSLPMRLR